MTAGGGGGRAREGEERTLVFVYGSLLAGEDNHHELVGAELVGPARTQAAFQLYDLGEFPAMVAAAGQAIEGEVYAVSAATLAALDRLEDHPRFYRRTSIVLADGSRAETYLVTAAQVVGRPVIDSGNWRAWRATGRRPR